MCDVVLAPVEIRVGKTFELGSPPLTGDQIKVFIEKGLSAVMKLVLIIRTFP